MFGCGVDPQDGGLLVRGAVHYTDDVGGFLYTLLEVGCDDGAPVGADELTATVRADELYRAVDDEAVYGEHYFTVSPGCYDVTSQPLRAATDEPSTSCLPAHARGVEVLEGRTTELVLISQCPAPVDVVEDDAAPG